MLNFNTLGKIFDYGIENKKEDYRVKNTIGSGDAK